MTRARAKNWSLAEAVEVVAKGEDTESILDITRRFPQVALLAARGDFLEIIKNVPGEPPTGVTARKVERVLKEQFEAANEDAEDTEETEEEEEAPKKKAPAKKKTAAKKKPAKKKPEPVEDEEDEDEDWDDVEEDEEEEEDLSSLTLPQLRKKAKAAGIDIKKVRGKKALIEALSADGEEDEDEDDDDFDDDEWDL